jgi:hypothetical protein
MARNLPDKVQGRAFKNPDEANHARYAAALELPPEAKIQYDMVLRLVEIVVELEQRIEALENK